MRTKEIHVPQEIIVEVAELLGDNNLTNEILGINHESEIIIEIQYEKEERDAVFSIIEKVDDYIESQEEEEED